MLLRGTALGDAEEVHPVAVLLVPVNNAVDFEFAMGERLNLFAVDVHVDKVFEMAGGPVSQR